MTLKPTMHTKCKKFKVQKHCLLFIPDFYLIWLSAGNDLNHQIHVKTLFGPAVLDGKKIQFGLCIQPA